MIEVTHECIAVEDLPSPAFSELLGYWQDLRGQRFAPSWEDVELIDLPAKVLPFLTVVEIAEGSSDLVYCFFGTGHLATKGRDYTARSVQSIRPRELADVMQDQYRRTIEARRPSAFTRRIHGFSEGEPLSQMNLRLPLSIDGRGVHGVMSLSSWNDEPELRDFYVYHARSLQDRSTRQEQQA